MVLSRWAVAAAGLLQAAALVSAHPAQSLAHSKILTRGDDVQDQYDYIIVGGGTAGLTVADRLTENGKCMHPSPQGTCLDAQATDNCRRLGSRDRIWRVP